MIQPQEIEVWYVLPSLKKEIVFSLLDKGISQKNVADLLGITPASVSQYKKNKRAKNVKFNEKIKKRICVAAENITDNNSCFTKELQELCKLVKEEGLLCKLHKKYCGVCSNCKVCL